MNPSLASAQYKKSRGASGRVCWLSVITLDDTCHHSSWEDTGGANDKGSALASCTPWTEVGANSHTGHYFLATRLLNF